MDEREDRDDPLVALQIELEQLHRGAVLIGEAQDAAQHTVAAARQVVDAIPPLVESLTTLAQRVDACVDTMAEVDVLARLDTIALTGRALQTAVQQVGAGSAALASRVQDLLETHAEESQAFLVQRLAEAVSRLHDLVAQHIDTTAHALTAQLEASIQGAQHTTSQQVTTLQTQCTQMEATVRSIRQQCRRSVSALRHWSTPCKT